MDIEKPQRIYIAGPYTGDSIAKKEANVKEATRIGIFLYIKGHYPFIPHLSHYVALEARISGIIMKWDEYMSTDLAWLKFADAMFFIGGSKGADIERIEALKLGMKIYYDIAEVPFIRYEDREAIRVR